MDAGDRKRRIVARALFWGATLVSLLLFALTAPDGLPWNTSTHWAAAYAEALGAAGGGASLPHPVWGHFVQTFAGNHVALACVAAALAAGWMAALAFRFFGWRVAVGAALAWTFAPWVWNRAVTGTWSVCAVGAGVFGAWALACAGHWGFRRVRAAQKAFDNALGLDAPPNREGEGKAPPKAHGKRLAAIDWNRVMGWVFLCAGLLFAVVSASLHDYRLGEAASVYARGVVAEAGDRVIVLNGVCDEQVVREVVREVRSRNEELGMAVGSSSSAGGELGKNNSAIPNSSLLLPTSSTGTAKRGEKIKVEGQEGTDNIRSRTPTQLSQTHLQTLSLRSDDAYRKGFVGWVKSAFPTETNLWVAAQVGAETFVEMALKGHSGLFYLMNGDSTTPEAWERRWAAFKPYLKSEDTFVPTGRRLFAIEGNAVANAMLDGERGEKVKVEGQGQEGTDNIRSRTRTPTPTQPPSPTSKTPNLQTSSAKLAWQMYRRLFEEVDPGNFSALVNMSEMVRRGYAISGEDKRRLQDALDQFFKDAKKRRYAREIARASGPIRTDPALLAKLEAEAKARISARLEAGEELEVDPELLTLVEWNNGMVRAMEAGDLVRAGRLARTILSNPKWRECIPANAVLGSIAAQEGDWAASEAFFTVATATTNRVPAVVLNDYADVLLHLGKTAEAEKAARRAVGESDEGLWVARLTLAQVLVEKVRSKGEDGGGEDAASAKAEIRALLRTAVHHCPTNMRDRVRAKVEKIRREVAR